MRKGLSWVEQDAGDGQTMHYLYCGEDVVAMLYRDYDPAFGDGSGLTPDDKGPWGYEDNISQNEVEYRGAEDEYRQHSLAHGEHLTLADAREELENFFTEVIRAEFQKWLIRFTRLQSPDRYRVIQDTMRSVEDEGA